jgi:hypothetical protein
MKTLHSSALVKSTSLPLPPSLSKLAEVFAPLFAEIDQHARRAAREEYAKLQVEQADAEIEAQRNEQRIDKYAAAERLSVTTQTVWEYYRKDLLPGVKVGNRILFRRGDVEALLQVQTKPDGRRKYARRATNQKGR